MIIGGSSRRNKNSKSGREPGKRDKASILARKRERWKVQKEVHETAKKFQGPGYTLSNDGEASKRPFLLPGKLESESPPKSYLRHRNDRDNRTTNNTRNSNNTRNVGLDEDILTRLTERIATRLRVELKNEAEESTKYDEGAKRDVQNKIESFLQNELQQHACPVCFEPMLPPKKSPMLLFPCGHTFCNECIEKQKKIATHKCPLCRSKIEKIAINHSLKQLMETFLQKKELIESGQSSLSNAFKSSNRYSNNNGFQNQNNGNANDSSTYNSSKAAEYMQKCRALKIRGKILKNELEDTKNNLHRLEKQKSSCSLVRQTLLTEEAAAVERLEAAKAALDLVRKHLADQNEKMDAIEKEKSECHQKIKLIQSTVATIDRDADKAYVLLQNFKPGAEIDI